MAADFRHEHPVPCTIHQPPLALASASPFFFLPFATHATMLAPPHHPPAAGISHDTQTSKRPSLYLNMQPPYAMNKPSTLHGTRLPTTLNHSSHTFMPKTPPPHSTISLATSTLRALSPPTPINVYPLFDPFTDNISDRPVPRLSITLCSPILPFGL